MRYDEIPKNDSSTQLLFEYGMQKAWHTVILVALFRAMTHSFKSTASLACRKYCLDNAFITGRKQNKTMVSYWYYEEEKKHIHITYLPKQNSAFGFCLTDASLTYNQVKSNLNKKK